MVVYCNRSRAGWAVDEPKLDPMLFRRVMGRFTTGVTVVTTESGGRVHGMTANAFMAASLDPPLCVVSVSNKARMHEHLQVAGHYGVSFLSCEQRFLSHHFSGRPLVGVVPEFSYRGRTPVLNRAAGIVAADIVDHMRCGDHTLFVGKVTVLEATDLPPLVFYAGRYVPLDREHVIAEVEPPAFW